MPRAILGTLTDPVFRVRYADPLFRLRHRVFHERLRWNVSCLGQREIDVYDDADTVYVVVVDDDDRVIGGWRLRPTLKPYMLDEVFPWLLHGRPAPRDARTWEASRFAVIPGGHCRNGFGFGDTSWLLLRETARYAVAQGLREYVMVLSAGVLRLLRHAGLRVHPYGPAVRIGAVLSAACRICIDAHTRRVLLGPSSSSRTVGGRYPELDTPIERAPGPWNPLRSRT